MKKKHIPWLVILALVVVGFVLLNRPSVIAKGEHYQITRQSGRNEGYTVTLYDADGAVRSALTHRLGGEPRVREAEGGLLEIMFPYGGNDWRSRYYDVQADILSDWFDSPLAAEYGRVLLVERKRGINCFVVRDIHTREALLAVECDFAPYPRLSDAVVSTQFLDVNTVSVVYEMGEAYARATETYTIPATRDG